MIRLGSCLIYFLLSSMLSVMIFTQQADSIGSEVNSTFSPTQKNFHRQVT